MELLIRQRLVASLVLTIPCLFLFTLIYFLKQDPLATELAILSSGLLAILLTLLTGLVLAVLLHHFKLKNLAFILKKVLIVLLTAGVTTIILVNFYPVNLIIFLVTATYLLVIQFNGWLKKDLEDVRIEPIAFLAVGFKVLIFILLIF